MTLHQPLLNECDKKREKSSTVYSEAIASPEGLKGWQARQFVSVGDGQGSQDDKEEKAD